MRSDQSSPAMMKNIWNHQRSRIWFPHAREGWLGSLYRWRGARHNSEYAPNPFRKSPNHWPLLVYQLCPHWMKIRLVGSPIRVSPCWDFHRHKYTETRTFRCKAIRWRRPNKNPRNLKKKKILSLLESTTESPWTNLFPATASAYVHIGIEKRRVPSWWEWSETQMGDEWVVLLWKFTGWTNETFLRLTCSWRRVTACSLSSLLILVWIRSGKKKLNGHKEKMFLIKKGMA